ncbi:hypothetical protein N032_00580 [Pseudomonas syringae pv. pisi str. PP1]|uniref:hypothetical protein n=1 Tax=Pseudomonas syringae TaxID=317 RepID=UPI000F3BD280|nr:hypothetical protein [Pseudomonas syringae]AZG84293.1 hypothetical protein N032_00580 [Pseudomonas syringae pv. pisi str. PP1]RMM26190.1 hypothetical protein ALQ81_01562 [Pseudomonas syringae pv. pisi]UZS62721.1 hypothetical protein OQB64_00520 [Pseudomonas syringae]
MTVSFAFVIDADIARSSGLTEHPVSSGSRKLLEAVAAGGHKAAMCPTLRKEWREHRSKFATRWMASMVAKKRIIFVTPTNTMKIHIEENVEDSKEKEVALKDCHLLDAALESDKIIASNDDRARAVFCKIALNNGEIRTISWFSAVADHHFFCDTLTSGGFVPKSYYLLPPGL